MATMYGILPLVAIAAVSALTLSGATKPDFTGKWKLNVAKSDLGGQPIKELIIDIDHKEPLLKYTATGSTGEQEFSETAEVRTDGTPTRGENGITTKVHWDGSVMVVEFSNEEAGFSGVARTKLSADGKTYERDMVTKSRDGEQKRHEIYEKQ